MPRFHFVPTKNFEEDFQKPKKVQGHVLRAPERIEADPHRGQKLVATKVAQWCYRVGDYRIRYDIGTSVVILHVVRHRKEVYLR